MSDDIATVTAAGRCDAQVIFAASAADNCAGASIECVPPSGSHFARGSTVVVCTATDAAGNTSECSFSVTVNDVELPVISCPADLIMNTQTGRCDAVAAFAATATDNCSALPVTCVPPSGSTFPKGTNTVNCIARDPSGNNSSCAFRVIVQDREPPVLTCPANFVTNSAPGRCDAIVSFAPIASDNCAGITVVCTPPSGSAFAVGATVVSCVATDASGNTNRCSFAVTVQDPEKPVIACPANILTVTEPGRCDAQVTFSANASDNCAVASVTCTPASGTRFSKGTTAVVCTARDSSGNEEGCSFNVTVNDSEPPAIT